jgi:hypothetical protein
MWSSTFPVEPPPVVGGWTELSYNRVVARGAAEIRAREQDKRLRQLRRRVERIDEAICLAEGASEARRHVRQQGIPWTPYRRSTRRGRGPIEHSHHVGQVLSVR